MTAEIEAKRPIDQVEDAVVVESAEKKQKTCDHAALKKQVEYYLSDANLKNDKFFHTKISENAEGWLSLTHILACNKTKALTTDAKDIVDAVSSSSAVETNESGDAIRRTSPLPAFEGELKRAIKGNKDKNSPAFKKQVVLGEFKFPNLSAAKKRVGEILKSRRAGVIFKEGTPDYNLVLAVLAEHPNAATKMEGMTGLKVDAAPIGDSRCFFIVKGEAKDQFEDISIVKAFANFESKLVGSTEAVKPAENSTAEETVTEVIREAAVETVAVEEPATEAVTETVAESVSEENAVSAE